MTELTRNERLAAYYRSGFSMRETAAKFGISMQRVHQILVRDFPTFVRPPHDTRQNSTGLTAYQRVRTS